MLNKIINEKKELEFEELKKYCLIKKISFKAISNIINKKTNEYYSNHMKSILQELENNIIKLEINYYDLHFKQGKISYYPDVANQLSFNYYNNNIHLDLYLLNKKTLMINTNKSYETQNIDIRNTIKTYLKNTLDRIFLDYLQNNLNIKEKIIENMLKIDEIRNSIMYVNKDKEKIMEIFNSCNIDINKDLNTQFLKINDYSKLLFDKNLIKINNEDKKNLKI